MNEAGIRFEREDIEGLVPVGAYLSDAAKRLGVKEAECDFTLKEHDCEVEILKGSHLLSEVTDEERELLARSEAKGDVRLACYAKIISPGDIEIMTKERVKTEKEEPEMQPEEYKKVFAELPLQQKLSNLMELEAIALGETFTYVMNAPYAVADKVMDVLAGFGFQKEEAQKRSVRPDEPNEPTATNGDGAKGKAKENSDAA
jgi:ferredoxin